MTRMTRMTRMIWMTRGLLQPPAAGRRLTGASQSGPDWSGPARPGRVGNLGRHDGAGARGGGRRPGDPRELHVVCPCHGHVRVAASRHGVGSRCRGARDTATLRCPSRCRVKPREPPQPARAGTFRAGGPARWNPGPLSVSDRLGFQYD